jgi:hypothetical protein
MDQSAPRVVPAQEALMAGVDQTNMGKGPNAAADPMQILASIPPEARARASALMASGADPWAVFKSITGQDWAPTMSPQQITFAPQRNVTVGG